MARRALEDDIKSKIKHSKLGSFKSVEPRDNGHGPFVSMDLWVCIHGLEIDKPIITFSITLRIIYPWTHH